MEKSFLKIIDSTSPFFERHPDMKINWSKIPFHHIEKNGRIRKKNRKKIRKNFSGYLDSVVKAGYNAISLDELPYLVEYPFYPVYLKEKTAHYRKYFAKLVAEAVSKGLSVFITGDVTFSNEYIEEYSGSDHGKKVALFRDALISLFISLPEVSGVILRIGESDGIDVKGDFLSHLLLKTPRQGNAFLRRILPVCEEFGKTCIFRTWTVGAYGIGDLIWNRRTYRQLFKGIESPNLIVSMKYGDSDFFRYLKLNRHIMEAPQRKIVEFQTRREYEGFGEFPVFIGWEYQRYMRKLSKLRRIEGISVWCSTGGWSNFRNFTYLRKSSRWNELNTYAASELMDGKKPKEIIRAFFKQPDKPYAEYLKLADTAVNTILYDPAFARNELFFNRSRIPPLLHVFWNTITVNEFVITFYRSFADSGESCAALQRGKRALKRMKQLNKQHDLDSRFGFFYDTFVILYYVRKLMYVHDRRDLKAKIEKKVSKYGKKYPDAYTFSISCNDRSSHNSMLRFFMKLVVRRKARYRYRDYLLFNGLTSRLYYALYVLYKKSFPAFTGKQAMPIKTLLR